MYFNPDQNIGPSRGRSFYGPFAHTLEPSNATVKSSDFKVAFDAESTTIPTSGRWDDAVITPPSEEFYIYSLIYESKQLYVMNE